MAHAALRSVRVNASAATRASQKTQTAVAHPAVTYMVRAGPRPNPQPAFHLFPAFEAMVAPAQAAHHGGPMPRTVFNPRSRTAAPAPAAAKPAKATTLTPPTTSLSTSISKTLRAAKVPVPALAKPAPAKAVPSMDYRRALAKLREAGLDKFRAKLMLKPLPKAEVKDVVVSEEVQALEDIELDPTVEGEPAHQDLVQRTYRPNRLKRKRTHGFLERLLSANGRRVLERRKGKGRRKAAP